jgi:hypothetical protein
VQQDHGREGIYAAEQGGSGARVWGVGHGLGDKAVGGWGSYLWGGGASSAYVPGAEARRKSQADRCAAARARRKKGPTSGVGVAERESGSGCGAELGGEKEELGHG